MFNTINHKKKMQLLLLGAGVMLYLAYELAIQQTLASIAAYQQLKTKQEASIHLPQRIVYLKSEIKRIDNLLSKQPLKDITSEQNILEIVTHYCKETNAILREFPRTQLHQEKDYQVELNVFTVEANFNTLLKLLYLLEQKRKTGRIVSLRFFSRKDNKTQHISLFLTLYIQNIQKNESTTS